MSKRRTVKVEHSSPESAEELLRVDVREVPQQAPAGTPLLLAKAYEAVYEALQDAAEMRLRPPTHPIMFSEQAHSLLILLGAARQRYAEAEPLLLAATGNDGRCAHREAVNIASAVNGAVGHVTLNFVAFENATAHIQAIPIFDLTAMLKAMRRQTSIAARSTPAVPDSLTRLADEQRLKTLKQEIDGYLSRVGTIATIWYHGERAYSTDQKTPIVMSNEQHNALKAFLECGAALDTKALTNAGINNVTKVMQSIDATFPGTIRRPERKGQGYFASVQRLTSTG